MIFSSSAQMVLVRLEFYLNFSYLLNLNLWIEILVFDLITAEESLVINISGTLYCLFLLLLFL